MALRYHDLATHYGVLEVSHGKLLWTYQESEYPVDGRAMFYVLDPDDVAIEPPNFTTIVIRDLRLLQLVRFNPFGSAADNAFVSLFQELSHLETDLQIKHDYKARAPFFKALHDIGFDGFIIPREGSLFALEIVLFDTSCVSPLDCMRPLDYLPQLKRFPATFVDDDCAGRAKRLNYDTNYPSVFSDVFSLMNTAP